jgi:hypothetical protein
VGNARHLQWTVQLIFHAFLVVVVEKRKLPVTFV